MKILLVSPLDPEKPSDLKFLMGGENTYTRTLLKYPPPGITFIHYEQALAKKLIAYHFLQNLFVFLQKARLLPLGPRIQAFVINSKFDLVYAHAYPVLLLGNKIPVVISDSSSSTVFLKKYLKWPMWRLKSTQLFQKVVFRIFGVIDSEVNPTKTKGIFVFSEWAKKIKKDLGIKNCDVVYPGLPSPKLVNKKSKQPEIKLLFVGVWFERKGGKILLSAFRRLAKQNFNIYLTILGPLSPDIRLSAVEPIVQKDLVSYRELISYYKSHDILVHVPPEIEGYGMTVPEAMSYGMVPVVSDICALPEFVENNKSGLIVRAGSSSDLGRALTRLIKQPQLRVKLRRGARARFLTKFSLPVFHKKINQVFSQAPL